MSKLSNIYKICILILVVIGLKFFTWAFGYFMVAEGHWEIDKKSYYLEFHHTEIDSRLNDPQKVDFNSLWRFADAEWYLSIAQKGYPTHIDIIKSLRQNPVNYRSTEHHIVQKYAFFPLFPTAIYLTSSLLKIPESTAAFYIVFFAGILAAFCFSLFYNLYFPENDNSIEAFSLLMLFPFSLFYSLFYAEIFFLILSLLVFYFLKKQRYFVMGIAGFLLALSRPHGFTILIPVLYCIVRETPLLLKEKGKKTLWAYVCSFLIPLGTLSYFALCKINTGKWDYYFQAGQFGWGGGNTAFFQNLFTKFRIALFSFNELPLHGFSYSKIDAITYIVFAAIILWMFMKRSFPRELALWSLLIWFTASAGSPKMTSFSRYMCVAFPVFIFWTQNTHKYLRYVTLCFFAVGYYFALKTVIMYKWLG